MTNMGSDIKQMYVDLNELLEDICQFLSEDKLKKLSPKDQNLAESLINRSKIQLQEIAKIQSNEEYMVMDKKVIKMDEDKITNSVDDDFNRNNAAVMVMEEMKYAYVDLPAKEASKEIKYGFIFMKRKFLLGFEKMKRVYASMHNGWLLIYFTERDTKPICNFNLRNYEAKECDGDKTDFQLISTMQGKETHHFLAQTPKDVRQWVTQINKCHDHAIMKFKMKAFEKQYLASEYNIQYDGVSDDEADSIYEELKTDPKSEKSNKTLIVSTDIFAMKPPLPGRSSTNDKSNKKTIKVIHSQPVVKTLPVHDSSDEDLGSYHEIEMEKDVKDQYLSNTTRGFGDSEADSFSDDNEDSIYEQFSTIQEKVRGLAVRSVNEISSEPNNGQLSFGIFPVLSSGPNNTKISTSDLNPRSQTSSPTSSSHALRERPIDGSNRIITEVDIIFEGSPKSMVNSLSEDSQGYTHHQCTVQKTEGHAKGIGNEGIPALLTKPKLKNKPSISLKPSILPTSVTARKH
ncbi:unnamed protein product [Phaedon cochleariae]|uniref:PH domain-containing protein n=1 Tax=Phaedon cochleariae TaxID=80249 RepID=A0A9P0GTL1_PHACE|nr:unnamed protein product [Phaedon cochleariae]